MGASKRFYRWLSRRGGRMDAPPVQQAIMGLKIFNRQLVRQEKYMEKQKEVAKDKAMVRRDRGDKAGSRRLMKSALKYEKWLKRLKDFRMDLDDMNFQLTTALDMKNFDVVGKALLQLLSEFRLQMGTPEIQRLMDDLDLGAGPMGPVYTDYIKSNNLIETVKKITVSEHEIDVAFGDATPEAEPTTHDEDENVLIENLPSAPGVDKSKAETDDEVFDLEAEIRRLRNQRNKRD